MGREKAGSYTAGVWLRDVFEGIDYLLYLGGHLLKGIEKCPTIPFSVLIAALATICGLSQISGLCCPPYPCAIIVQFLCSRLLWYRQLLHQQSLQT
ncbi:unnamed protein product [Choristocarpus tenellus]